MLALLSPAKSLDLTSPLPTRKHSAPRLLDESQQLIDLMRSKDADEVARMMEISVELAELNVRRYADFERPFTRKNARPAVLMFAGDVYQAMNPRVRFDERDYSEAQKTLRILSGLYGILRPLDLTQPYRLEMGIAVQTERGRSLYDWWGRIITDLIAADLAESPGSPVLVNLASEEYSKSVKFNDLDADVISPRFEDQGPTGDFRVVSFTAKRARGEMAAWLVQRRVRTAGALKKFDAAGYVYAPQVSTATVPVFRRSRG